MQAGGGFVKHHSNHDLATITVYTKDRTPEQTCDEILRRLNCSGGSCDRDRAVLL